jgi:hypothetical protein
MKPLHPWRWYSWLATSPLWLPVLLLLYATSRSGTNAVIRFLERTSDWCREGEEVSNVSPATRQ